MINQKLIQAAVNLIEQYNSTEHIFETKANIINKVLDWYNHTEIVDAEMLAAVSLTGDFNPDLNWDELCGIKEFFFPSEPIEITNFHISEIEMAQLDSIFWR